MAHLIPNIKQRFLDSNGNLLALGKLYSYQAGTTTPLATFTDETEGANNPNPIILDANGEAQIWLGSSSYKFVLKDASDVVQWTVDQVAHINDLSIVTAKLADGAVATVKIADSAVTTAKIVDSAVATAKLASKAVTTAKIADGAVNTLQIADSAVGTAEIADGAVTSPKLAAVGQQISGNSGGFSTPNIAYTDVTNLSVTITTTGRPVYLGLISPGGSATGSLWKNAVAALAGGSTTSMSGSLAFVRGTTVISENQFGIIAGANAFMSAVFPPGVFFYIDIPAAGTYTYKVQVLLLHDPSVSGVITVDNCKLVAWEIK